MKNCFVGDKVSFFLGFYLCVGVCKGPVGDCLAFPFLLFPCLVCCVFLGLRSGLNVRYRDQ